MATTTFNAQEMEARRQILMQELATLQDAKLKAVGGMQVIDFHHPERSPGWPIYRHQEYPKLMYHPTAKDQRIEEQRLGIRRRNESNPNLAPMDVPPSEPLILKVYSSSERSEAFKNGFLERAPEKQSIDQNSPAELIGRALTNPLTENQPQTLSVESIIKLNQMGKDELVAHAKDVYGVELPEDASKVDIITAIQKEQ